MSTRANEPVERMAAGGSRFQCRALWVAAIAHFFRYASPRMKLIACCATLVLLCSCAATVESVSLTRYPKPAPERRQNKDSLGMIVNTRRGLFQSLHDPFTFTRDYYVFSLLTQSNSPDKEILTFSYARPLRGVVEIQVAPETNSILLNVAFQDDRIPRLLNGVYRLRLSEIGRKGEIIYSSE